MPRVALVVLDTLRKDVFDTYFDWLPGTRFDNAWSSGHYTVSAHGSLFTGKYPSEIGVHSQSERFDCSTPSIAEQLQAQNVQTEAISGNLLASPLNDFDRGFDEYHPTGRAIALEQELFDWKAARQETTHDGLLRDPILVLKCALRGPNRLKSLKYGWKLKTGAFHSAEDTLRLIKNRSYDPDHFLYVNLMDVHSPYLPPKPYRSVEYSEIPLEYAVDMEERAELQRQAYRDAATYLSDRYHDIFDQLISDFDYVITVSDHGELFGEYGMRKHIAGVFPELVHIPLCVSDGSNNITRSDRSSSLLDVHETIASIYGIDTESEGNDLLLDNPVDVNYMTEYHGLRPSYRRQLEESSLSMKRLRDIDHPMRGIIVADDGSYIYQEYDRLCTADSGKPSDHHSALFEEETARLRAYETRIADTPEVGANVEDQLEDLGYL